MFKRLQQWFLYLIVPRRALYGWRVDTPIAHQMTMVGGSWTQEGWIVAYGPVDFKATFGGSDIVLYVDGKRVN